MDNTLQTYYSCRAHEYEAIYHRDDPVRKQELSKIAEILRQKFQNRSVLEIACGTGYWTGVIASVAAHVTAIDFSAEVLEIAKSKPVLKDVSLVQDDAYALSKIGGQFDGGLANFWFSHVPKSRISQFLKIFHEKLGAGAVVFMCDNMYVPGLGGDLVTKPDSEDTFKLRTLADGSTYEVLKNYFSYDELNTIFMSLARDLQIEMSANYWWLTYRVR